MSDGNGKISIVDLVEDENRATLRKMKDQAESMPAPHKECKSKDLHASYKAMHETQRESTRQITSNQLRILKAIMGWMSGQGDSSLEFGKLRIKGQAAVVACRVFAVALLIYIILQMHGLLPWKLPMLAGGNNEMADTDPMPVIARVIQ